jgi:S1-C subfamily serine protease
VITDVGPDSPASRAGIEAGDIVVDVDGTPIDGQGALIAAIRDRSPGDTVAIDVLRGGSRLTLTATLVERPVN